MKIHGTAKGAALSTKDFGVAFSAAGGVPTPDYEDDFSTNPTEGNWTLTGVDVTYDATNDLVNLNALTGDVHANFYGLKLDLQDVLGGSNLDNEKFVIQFTWDAYSWTKSTNGYYCDVGIWLTTPDPSSATAGDCDGFKFGGGNVKSGGDSYQQNYCLGGFFETAWQAFKKDAQSIADEVQWVDVGVAPVTGTEIGMRLIRTSATGFKSELYADADFESSPTTTTLTDTSLIGNIEDVRYLLLAGYKETGTDGTNQANFDNLKIYNGINL